MLKASLLTSLAILAVYVRDGDWGTPGGHHGQGEQNARLTPNHF